MKFLSWEISIVALLPALFLCGFVYYKDRIEREPFGLLGILFAAGGIAYLPAIFLERLVSSGIDAIFRRSIEFSADGMMQYTARGAGILHQLLYTFIGVALVEVCMKWCILYFITQNNKNFNYLFDGIVYSVFVSLGYAAVENVRYAWANGWDTLLLRSLSSVPCHLFVGILMGYYYTIWHAYRNAERREKILVQQGLLAKEKIRNSAVRLLCSFLVPFFTAGICLFASSMDSRIVTTVFCFIVFSLYGMSFIGVDRIASRDKAAGKYLVQILKESHPEAEDSVWEQIDAAAETETASGCGCADKGEEK